MAGKVLVKAAIEGGQQFLQRMGKAKTLPKLSGITTDNLVKHIDANKGVDIPDIETMFKGMVNGDSASYTAFDEFDSTKMAANQYQQNVSELERAVKPQQPDSSQAFQDTTTDDILKKFPIQPQNIDTDLPNFIPEGLARSRNKAMKAAGITEYLDEHGHKWRQEGDKTKQWRNTAWRNATKKAVNPFTGEIGTRLASTKRYVNKRLRGLAASSPEEAKYIAEIEKTKADINKRLNLKKDDPNFMTIEHRIAQHNWKKWNLPGNPHDSVNLWLSTKYEAGIKTKIENILRTRKSIKNRYVVDFNPEDNALHIMEFDKFKLNEAPTGQAFSKDNSGKYDWDAINEYLKTLE